MRTGVHKNVSVVCSVSLFALTALTNGAFAQCQVAPVIDTMLLNGFRGNGEKLMDRDGDWLVIGTSATDSSGHGLNSGVARVYHREGMSWSLQATLIPDDLMPQDKFGDAVSIDGNTIVVGAPTQDLHGDNSGAAYVYRFNGTDWVQTQKLLPTPFTTNQAFGGAIAVDGSDLLIGAFGDNANGNASGVVYAYTNPDPNTFEWTLSGTIRPDDNDTADFFGVAIDIDQGRAAIGAFENERPGQGNSILPGSVYLYERDANGWTQTDNLYPPDNHGAGFGFSVDLNGSQMIVGAPNSSVPIPGVLLAEAGAVYIYQYDGSTWGVPTIVTSLTPDSTDKLGQYVAIDGNVAVADAPQEYLFPTPPGPGRLSIFSRDNNGAWFEADTFTGGVTGFVGYRFFGIAPVLVGNEVVVGTGYQDLHTGDGGASLVTLDLGCMGTSCPADLTGDGVLNFFDVSLFLNAFNANDPLADITGDGLFNFFDVAEFIGDFSAGCP